jgi:hypothetical protein
MAYGIGQEGGDDAVIDNPAVADGFGQTEVLGVRFFTLGVVGNPEKSLGETSPVDSCQDCARQSRHKSLMRESMATEQIREALRLVIRWSKDS